MTNSQLGELAALATAALWTLSALVWTTAGKRQGALAVAFLRLLLALPLLSLHGAIARGHWFPTDADARTWWVLAISGFFGFFLADLCMVKAFLLVGPRLTVLIQALSPPIAAIVSWIVLDDTLALLQWVAMAVTLAGVAWVVLERPDAGTHPHDPAHLALGVALSVTAAAAAAIGMVLSKKGIGQYDPVAGTYVRIVGGIAGYVALITVVRRWPLMWRASKQPREMAILAIGAFIGPFLGVALSLVALRNCPAGVAATLIATMPVMILPAVIFVYREKVSLRAAGGAAVSVAGVALLMLA